MSKYDNDFEDFSCWNQELKLMDVNPYKYDNMERGLTQEGSNYHISEDGIFKHCGE